MMREYHVRICEKLKVKFLRLTRLSGNPLFGTLLDENIDDVGSAGTYNNVAEDAWVMTKKIKRDLKKNDNIGGHELIIDGYDDAACATYREDHETKQQCGLLRIRNSWGTDAGDQGDYYMSYAYFKVMVDEAHEIK